MHPSHLVRLAALSILAVVAVHAAWIVIDRPSEIGEFELTLLALAMVVLLPLAVLDTFGIWAAVSLLRGHRWGRRLASTWAVLTGLGAAVVIADQLGPKERGLWGAATGLMDALLTVAAVTALGAILVLLLLFMARNRSAVPGSSRVAPPSDPSGSASAR